MNLLKPDSPVMNFLSTVADLILVNLLFIICCIPVVTIGASYTAKYYVSMKIIRGEGSGVIVPFFKSFARNFKQATIIWLIQLVAVAVIFLDWRWAMYNGWSNTGLAYKIGIIAFSLFVTLVTVTIFPTLARYKMKTLELYKAALMLVFIKLIPLVLIVALYLGSIVACIWYAQWFPVIYVFCSTTITYFLSIIFIKQFDKLEKAQADKLKALEEQVEYDPEVDAAGNISLAGSKKDVKDLEEELNKPEEKPAKEKEGNKLKNFIKTEKEKLADLTGKQKLEYFAQYYLGAVLLVIVLIGAFVWYGIDVYRSNMTVLSGGLINCEISDSGKDYLTKGFLTWGGYKKTKRAKVLESEEFNFSSDLEYEENYLDLTLRAAIMTGEVDYLIVREDAIDNYATTDYFQDMNKIVSVADCNPDDFYYFVLTEEEKAQRSQGVSLNDIFKSGKEKNFDPVPVAIKLTDETEKKLGLDEQYTYYIAFANPIGTDKTKDFRNFFNYLYNG